VVAVPGGIKFMMWREVPALCNLFTNTTLNERMYLTSGTNDLKNIIKWLCFSDFKIFHSSNFEIKNLRFVTALILFQYQIRISKSCQLNFSADSMS
jgi:hypothetical protein